MVKLQNPLNSYKTWSAALSVFNFAELCARLISHTLWLFKVKEILFCSAALCSSM